MNLSLSILMPIISEALGRGQNVRIVVNGESMRPFIANGDVVELMAPRNPATGDIILIRRSEDDYLLHRVVVVIKPMFFVRGDSQRCVEGPFANSDIIGKVRVSIRNGKVRNLNHELWRFIGLLWVWWKPIPILLAIVRYRSQINRTSL